MADSELRPSRSRRHTSRAVSQRSGASRPRSLHRTLSAGAYLDDQASYLGHSHHDSHKDTTQEDDSGAESDLSEKDSEIIEGQDTDIVPEVKDGIEDQRDLEAGPDLEKSKTARSRRSVRDPNLVSWDGTDDPKNPKNWSHKHKWAATLVGK